MKNHKVSLQASPAPSQPVLYTLECSRIRGRGEAYIRRGTKVQALFTRPRN